MDTLSTGTDGLSPTDVVLVSMPFGVLHSPSLALGILQARLNAAGIGATSRYFTLDYAARVGQELYNRIASGFPRTIDLFGEWIFSHAISPKSAAQQLHYMSRTFGAEGLRIDSASSEVVYVGSDENRARLVETILRLAATAGDFIDYAAHEILKYSPKVVGLTSVFQQNTATLAVAARLRQLDKTVKIVMGGSNCDGPMGRELSQSFPFVDCIVSGEADWVVVSLVRTLLAGESPHTSPQVRPYLEAVFASGSLIQTKMVNDLSSYVSPVFDGYFRDLGRLSDVGDGISVQIPLETSRGCWWGVKNHCTFCGLNGSTMAFRSRRPDDALQEIVANTTRHPGAKISFVDNIMDYKYYDLLLPKLAQLGADLDLFYEIKSNVTKSQVKALKDAGIRHVQPGIESLSDQVLKIMKKGVKAIQNIQLLKWCTEYGIKVDWNFLWGFPGEDPDEYRKMAQFVPLLCHLEPPARGSEIRLDRFSPNFTKSAELGWLNVRPYEAYYDVYHGLSREAVFNLSYFFQADRQSGVNVKDYTRDLADAVEKWSASHTINSLVYLELEGRVAIIDSRSLLSGKRVFILNDLESTIYLLCDKAHAAASIAGKVPNASAADITKILDGFCKQGSMWSDGVQYLSLAVSFTTYLLSRGTVNMEEAVNSVLAPRTEVVAD